MGASPKMLLLKGEPKTTEIDSIGRTGARAWSVKFKNSDKTFVYSNLSVRWLAGAQPVPLENRRVYRGGRRLEQIDTLWRFHTDDADFWRVKYETGKQEEYKGGQISVLADCLGSESAKTVFDYLHGVASVNQLGKTSEQDSGILTQFYEDIEFIDDRTAAACYLDPKRHKPGCLTHKDLIYPFGCNASQKEAIAHAFESQMSIIQGPPGTGKTQTILNIIANIVCQGKTVMVVSSNNSATENILKKMEEGGVSFIVAPLGSHENKEKFIQAQPPLPDELERWSLSLTERRARHNSLHTTLTRIETVYVMQKRLAELRQELQAVELEWKHFCIERQASPDVTPTKKAKSADIIRLWIKIQAHTEGSPDKRTNIVRRLRQWWIGMTCRYKWHITTPLDPSDPQPLVRELQTLYFANRRRELESDTKAAEDYLQANDAGTLADKLSAHSLSLFRAALCRKYKHGRETFGSLREMRRRHDDFLGQYPVVLSTTFSARSCLMGERLYDYVIMDEASQVSVETGALALTCAENAVIVGDTLQLPNVVTEADKARLQAIRGQCRVAESYDSAEKSFLQSVCDTIRTAPRTLLREHYRCHPRIIDFCNKRFYGDRLLIMTRDRGEGDPLSAIRTVVGNHAVGHYNQREIDVVRREALPAMAAAADIGIITPYSRQAEEFRRQIPGIEAATIHKYQGREKDCIIMSAVDNQIGEFADNPNLLNVAVSRARKKFCLVVSGNEQERQGNIQSLLDYIAYSKCEVSQSKTASIFDYLYAQYTARRMEMLSGQPETSEYASERLTYLMLTSLLASEARFSRLHVVCHVPLRTVIRDTSPMDEEERRYAGHPCTHLDFLIVDRVSHLPVMAVETDGYAYHNEATAQHRRDLLKDNILRKYGLPLLRLSTKGSCERERARAMLLTIV